MEAKSLVKVLLVNPPQIYNIGGNLPSFVDNSRGCSPPLGLLYLAAIIEREHDCEIIDIAAGDKLEDYKEKPDVVGITTTTFTLLDTLDIAKDAKKLWNCKVIVGGIHPSIYPIETILLDNIDYVFVGEGEVGINIMLRLIERNTCPRIFYGKAANIQELPYPARNKINKENYSSILGIGKYITTMFTSRGCPYNCIFCHRRTMGKEFRARTAEQVFQEMVEIRNLGIEEILIYDDTFTIDKARAINICDLIITTGLDISFDIRTRVDCVNEKLLTILKEAGCKRIHYGVEASDNATLKRIGKGIQLEQVEDAFKLTKEVGIDILAYFILGSPGEDENDVKRTIEYAKKLNPDYCHFAIMTPYPDTPLYLLGLINKRYSDYWNQFAREPNKDFKAPYWANNIELIEEYLNKAYREFYWRPKRIIKEVYKTKSLAGLVKKSKAGIKMLAGRK